MTSLKEQLEKLAIPHIQNSLSLDTRRVSLLFDSKEAANLDREYLFDLGINGLEEMLNIDRKFEKYKKMLFSRNYINFNRNLQTKELNKKLDKLIRNFFIDISPYFLLKPAQKMLEWLVYRYHIQLFNVDDWLITILAFHNTPMFVRVLTILKLEKPTNKWHWLHQSAKSGIPIPRQVLINQCQKNPGIFRSICNLVWLYQKHLSKDDSQHLHLAVSLVTIAVLGVLRDAHNINEENMSIIFSTLLKGITSSLLGLRASSMMMAARLIYVTNLKQEMLKHLAILIVKNIQNSLYTESICCLSIVLSKLHTNETAILEIFKSWNFEIEDIDKLLEIAENYDITNILKILKNLKHLNMFDHLIIDDDLNENKGTFEQRLLEGDFKDEMKIKSLSLIEKENLLGLLGSKDKKIILAVLNFNQYLLELVDISKLSEILLDLTRHLLKVNKWFKVITIAIRVLCLIYSQSNDPKILLFFFSILTSQSSTVEFKELCIFICNNSRIIKNSNSKEISFFLKDERSSEIYLQYMLMLVEGSSDLIKDMIDVIYDLKWDDSLFGLKCFLILCCVNLFPSFTTLIAGSHDLKMIKITLKILSSFNYKKCQGINNLNNEEFIHLLFNSKPEDFPLDLAYNFIFSLLKRFNNEEDMNLIIDDLLEIALTLDSSLDHSESISIFKHNLKESYFISKLFECLMPDSTKSSSFLLSCVLWLRNIIRDDPSIISKNTVNSLQLLLLLGHPNQLIRKQTCKICNCLKADVGGGGDGEDCLIRGDVVFIFPKLLMHKDEIIMDEKYIATALASVLTELTEKEMNSLLKNVFDQLATNALSKNLIYLTFKTFHLSSLQNFTSQLNEIGDNFLKSLKENNLTNINSLITQIIEIVIELLLSNIGLSNAESFTLIYNCYDAYIQEATNASYFRISSYLTNKVVDHFNVLSNVEFQRKLVSYSIDATLITISNHQENIFGSALKQLKLESKHISHELLLEIQEFDEPPAKTKRLYSQTSEKMKRIIIILESLQNRHKYSDHKEMAQLLFHLLSKLVIIEDADAEYCRLLTLTSLHLVFKAAIKKKVEFTQDILNIEAVMQCIHHSAGPQTHQQIILLLTELIPIFPEYMLHNIVSVFTFMGSIIFQRDDIYTFQTIKKTIDVIVDSLIKRENSDVKDAHKKSLEVLHVFVDMRGHMPSHRCKPLFMHLITQMATPLTLFYLSVLMVENGVKYKMISGNEVEVSHVYESQPTSSINSCLEFIVGLFNEISLDDQIESLIMICEFIYKLFFVHKQDKISTKMDECLEIINMASLNLPHLRRSILFNLSKLMIMILSNREFIVKVLELTECAYGQPLEIKFEKLVQECVIVLIDVSDHQQVIARKKVKVTENESKFLPQLLKAITSILEKVNYIISINCFLELINSLMMHENIKIKLKSLELLSTKLQQIDLGKINPNEVDSFLHLLPQLLSCLDATPDVENVKTIESVKQMCLFNIKLLTRILGSNRPVVFLPAFFATTRILNERQEKNACLINSAMLCLAELTATFKTHALPHLQTFMSSLLHFCQLEDILNSELSVICLITSLNKIISSLAEFISPFIQPLIIQICSIESKSKQDNYLILQKPAVQEKIRYLSNVISSQISSRVFLPNIFKAIHDVIRINQASAEFVFILLKEHLELLKKKKVPTATLR